VKSITIPNHVEEINHHAFSQIQNIEEITLPKTIKKIEISQRKKYPCQFCGKTAVKRTVVGVWTCMKCGKATTGGAYTPTTPAALTARAAIKRLREAQSK